MFKFMSVFIGGLVSLTVLFLAGLTHAASVTFEAESGTLGSDFTNGTGGTVQFISISTNTVNTGNPGWNQNRLRRQKLVECKGRIDYSSNDVFFYQRTGSFGICQFLWHQDSTWF
jgi:hypothetical protein